jgi:hypothetical protein
MLLQSIYCAGTSIFDPGLESKFMAACDPIQFKGITPEVFSSISKQLAANGFALSGPSGTVNGPFGIVIDYSWDESNSLLNIHVVEKSFFVTCNQIKEQLNNVLAKYA